MRTTFKYLLLSLSRFKAATFLNLIGLSVAFASFLIIMAQVRYDLTFDKGYPNAGTIYEIDLWRPISRSYSNTQSQFLLQEISQSTPLIRQSAFLDRRDNQAGFFDPRKGSEGALTESTVLASSTLPELFGLEWLEGNPSAFHTPNAALLSKSTARRLFGDESPVGQQLGCIQFTESEANYLQVVGIYEDLPENSSLPNGVIFNAENNVIPGNQNFLYTLYLQIDTPEQAAQVELLLTSRYPEWISHTEDSLQPRPVRVIDLHDYYFTPSNGTRSQGNLTTDYALIAIALLILAIAIINFINFSTALVPRRIRNINTRKVLGSSLASLRFEQVAEAMILALLAGGVAILIVSLLADTRFSSLFIADIHPSHNIFLIYVTLGVALLSGMVAGLYPAFYSTSFPTALALKGSFGLSVQGRRLRITLIGFQYLISLVLIMVASLIYHQYSFMRNYDIGLSCDNILSTQISARMSQQRDVIAQKLKENPNIQDVTFSFTNITNPGSSSWSINYRNQRIQFTGLPVAPNFPAFMNLPIIEGRDFRELDRQRNGTFLFNRTAQEQFDIQIGDRIANPTGGFGEIVGITEDFNLKSLYYSIEPVALYIFQDTVSWPLLELYAKVNPVQFESTRQYIEETLLSFDPSARNVVKVEFLNDQLEQRYRSEKKLAFLIFAFSLLAILICSVGAFGLILFETQYRRKEIALRKTFGATVGDILKMFNRRYVAIVLVCFVPSVPIAYLIFQKWQQNFAYQAPFSLWILGMALGIVLLITLATVTWQSYRSATENPAHSIKQE